MFDSLLIANRGEIACRIARTAKRLGIRVIAVYSEADADALHVAMADEAVCIGPPSARQSYLKIEAIIDAARTTGAVAIHPGYGFLSENAEFAAACAEAGLVFVGPSAEAIRVMGSKSEAKALLAPAGVPLVPGYHGENQDLEHLAAAADEIGYPVLVKASAGGGGRGMRIVEAADGFAAAVAAAQRESKAAFGDDRLLIEKFLMRPRHVEVQIFGDSHGNAIHLFERDCSIQRRHQKVVEEAPAPGLGLATRRAMGEAAVAAARAIDYVGAGTIEFLLDESGDFFFIEMNTRLQVEHPVTEFITGQDLVEWQLRVAAGEALPRDQDSINPTGHAIEVRLYAEDPARGFLPQTGRLVHLRWPEESPHVRVDSGVGEGDEISIHYDPMIAKLAVWDQDRTMAVRRLRQALGELQIVGVETNATFLSAVAGHAAFAAADVDTHFIERHADDLLPAPEPASDTMLALAALFVLRRAANETDAVAARSGDPYSPWFASNGWRLNDRGHAVVQLRDGERLIEITAHYLAHGFNLALPGGEMTADAELAANGDLIANLGGLRLPATVVARGEQILVMAQGRSCRLGLYDPAAAAALRDPGGGRLTAPMPGKIVRVLVADGETVQRGAALVVIEAMKMEHTISAPADGVVEKVVFAVGDQVDEGVELISFQAGAADR